MGQVIEYLPVVTSTGLPYEADETNPIKCLVMDPETGLSWNPDDEVFEMPMGMDDFRMEMTASGSLWVLNWAGGTAGTIYRFTCQDYLGRCVATVYHAVYPMSTYYITYQDLDARMDGLADLIPDGKDAEAYVSEFIADAQAEVDAALSARYSVPFASAPALVKRITSELAKYLLLRENYHQEGPEISDWVEEYRVRARELLDRVVSGDLPVDTTETGQLAISNTTDVAREISRTTRDSEGTVIEYGTLEAW